MKRAKIAYTCGLVLLTFLLLNCQSVPPAHVVLVIDRSDSVNESRSQVLGLAEVSKALPGVRKKSLLTIIATGDALSSMEPISVGSILIPKNNKLMETKGEAKLNESFLREVSKLLQNMPGQADATPLYMAIRRGVEVLRGQGCGSQQNPSATCYLFAITDGEETEEKSVRKALYGAGKVEFPKLMTIQNDGINVVFYGISGTNQLTPARNHFRADRLETVWKGLFSNPENISFQPFCPKKEIPQ